ncbi:MAG: hypothetical protein R2867_35710 [Caldilineaceae bacterium]
MDRIANMRSPLVTTISVLPSWPTTPSGNGSTKPGTIIGRIIVDRTSVTITATEKIHILAHNALGLPPQPQCKG